MITPVYKQNVLFGLLSGIFFLIIGVAAFTEIYLLAIVPVLLLFFYAGWQNRNTVFFLLMLTLPVSFEYKLSPGLGTDMPDEFLMVFVSGLFMAWWLHTPKALSKNILQHPLLLLLLTGFIWSLVTVSFSTHQLISLKFILAKSWYIGAFVLAPLIIFREKKHIAMVATLLAGSMLIITSISLIKHSTNGFSFASINKAISPFFRNHVNYSAMLVCMIPLLFAFFKFGKTRNTRIAVALAIVTMLTALFFSYSRGAWLALLAGLTAWRLIQKKALVVSYVIALIFAIGSLFWIKSDDLYLRYAHDYRTTIFHKDFREHLIATYQLKDVSTAERFYRWIAGVRMLKENRITGFGPNTFYDNYKPYGIPAFKTWVSDNRDHSTIHNYFLLIAIEQGIPGLLFFLVLSGAMLYYAQYLFHRVKDVFYKTVAVTTGVVLTMIIVVNFLSDLIETDKIGSLFFLCLSTLLITDINTRAEKQPSTNQ